MLEKIYDVVIIGAGMVGATLACALGVSGFNVAIVEAHEPEPNDGQGKHDLRVSAVSAGSQRVLNQIGVWPLIASRRYHPFEKMQVWDAQGFGQIRFDCVEVAEPYLGLIIENSVTQSALQEKLMALERVQWICPESLDSISVASESVCVRLFSGREIRAKLLVGADGPASRVRKLSGLRYQNKSYAQQGIVAQVRTREHHQNTAWQRFLPTGPLAFLPLSDGSCSIVWTHSNSESLLSMPDKEFMHELEDAFEYRLGAVTECSDRAVFPLMGGEARDYVRRRIALIGDAAHSVHPLAGQGVNLGFTDAAMLAQILQQASHDIGSLRVLRRYERARKIENVVMKRALEGFRGVFGSTFRPVVKLRNSGLDFANQSGPLKRLLIRQAMGILGERPVIAAVT